MIKYRTHRTRRSEIEAIEVERESPSQITLLNGRRENRRSEWQNWHDTWEDAHEFLIAACQQKVDKAQQDLEKAAEELMRVTALRAPK